MPAEHLNQPTAHGDGTSQDDRAMPALRPDYVAVDERSIADFVAFAQDYSRELRYFDLDDEATGDWRNLVPARLTPSQIAEFVEHPTRFTPNEHPQLFRPHFTLFLAFLKQIERCQTELNTFTERHLDHYFRDVLRMNPKPPVPDSVNVIIEPGPAARDVLLPAGTLLSAGPDSLGRDQTYATERDLVVTRAQVDALRSIHVERRITGLREARERQGGNLHYARRDMLRLALGRPDSSGELRLPPYPPDTEGEPDAQLIRELKELAEFSFVSPSGLHLKLFEFKGLMELKRRRDRDADEWQEINGVLEALATRNGHAPFEPSDPRDFDANLRTAVGGAGGELPSFDELPEVDTVDDLYDFRTRQEVKDFITGGVDDEGVRVGLGFATVDAFVQMMQTKVRIDGEWREINRFIEGAGRRVNAAFELFPDPPDFDPPDFDPTDFSGNVRAAIGEPVVPARLDAPDDPQRYFDDLFDSYLRAIVELETYFSISADEFLYVVNVFEEKGPWAKVDAILTDAHRAKFFADRRKVLADLHEHEGVDAMLRHVLGEPPSDHADPDLLDRIEPFLGIPTDIDILRAAVDGGDDVDWDRVYVVAEIAQRNREELVEPVPEIREWINLHAAADATAAAIPMGADGDITRWPTFGAEPGGLGEHAPTPLIGWAVGTPILDLAEGTRIIDLTLGFRREFDEQVDVEAFADSLVEALDFEVSTGKGWVSVAADRAPGATTSGSYGDLTGRTDANDDDDLADLMAMRFRLELDEQADPIAPLPDGQHGPGATAPALRATLARRWSDKLRRYVMPYSALRDLELVVARLAVRVDGLTSLRLRNDDADLDPSGPFEPFSRKPAAGSRFLIGHPELARKKLDEVTFRFAWMDVPDDLTSTYYRNYPRPPNTFTAAVELVDRRRRLRLAPAASLFPSEEAADGKAETGSKPEDATGRPSRTDRDASETIHVAAIDDTRLPAASTTGDLASWDRYLSWELRAPDFQHGAYPRVASAKALELAAAIAAATEGTAVAVTDYQVNPPYTPKMKGLTVDYRSSVEIRLDRPRSGPDELYHLHPFGYSAIGRDGGATAVHLIPRYDNEGELYIGLRGARPPQTVSLLFQMAEGSADPDLEPATVQWSYASGGQWLTLDDGSVLHDSTRGLISSGVVELRLAEAAPATLLPGDRYWLRAAVADHSASVADTVAIRAQAVSATFVDDDNAPDHYTVPLPAESITKPLMPVSGVAGVQQPYTSRGGRPAEERDRVATRVSERLRHKGRALTVWDYEHLVLEQFPELFKVKCIPATDAAADLPGRVDIVVVPDIRNTLPFNSFEPKASAELLARIHEFVSARAPGPAAIDVKNAHFRAVKVRCGVRFTGTGNVEFYKKLLTDDLDRFLSPWAWDEGADIVIGSRIYATSLVNFLDRRPYVDFVADLRLFFSDDGSRFHEVPQPKKGTQGYHVEAGRPDAILRAANHHDIVTISKDGYRAELLTGIGFMKVELDLQVG